MKPTVVMLAAGENSRFFPLNTTTHKGALTLLGKPLIIRTLENLEAKGYTSVVIIVSPKEHKEEGIIPLITHYPWKSLTYTFVTQEKAEGMGEALLHAHTYLSDEFAILFPHEFTAADTLDLMLSQKAEGGALLANRTKEPWLYGILTVDKQNKIQSIVEKPQPGKEPSDLMATGIYLLKKEFMTVLQKTEKSHYSFEAALQTYFQMTEVQAVITEDPFPQLKYPWHLFNIQKKLFKTMPSYRDPESFIAPTALLDETQGPIYVAKGAKIGHCAKIVGPCYIGENYMIGDFSLIRQSSFEQIGYVGAYSEVTRSILMQGANMHNGFVGDSIIGRNVNIAAQFLTANMRIDRTNISVRVKGEKVATGTDHFGTIIGDNAKIGIRVNIMPGKFIGSGCIIGPCETVYSHVKQETQQRKGN